MTISPAWSEAFAAGARDGLARTDPPFGRLDRQDVFGDADGQGVTVAIIDSGVDGDHPAVRGRVVRHLRVDLDGDEAIVVDDPEALDLVGHGTACAGIVAASPRGRASCRSACSARTTAARGEPSRRCRLDDAAGIAVVNLSLSSRSEAMFSAFHALADRSYFANSLLVCAANNVPARRIRRCSHPSCRSRHTTSPTRRPGSITLTSGRVRRARSRRRCRVARRWSYPRDGQLVRRAAPGRSGRAIAVALSDSVALRDQALLAATATSPPGRNRPAVPGGSVVTGRVESVGRVLILIGRRRPSPP